MIWGLYYWNSLGQLRTLLIAGLSGVVVLLLGVALIWWEIEPFVSEILRVSYPQ